MHISSFEPMVMFFRMTNSLAMFQAIMNKILRDLINKGKVAVFETMYWWEQKWRMAMMKL